VNGDILNVMIGHSSGLDLQVDTSYTRPLSPCETAVSRRISVCGYRENQLVRPNGLIASLESRILLVRNRRSAELLQAVPFVDIGRGWNGELKTRAHNAGQHKTGLALGGTFHIVVPLRAPFEVLWGHRSTEVGRLLVLPPTG
jgi:hemolysin activation/secretion protein